jgi:hypothetical protein
VVNSVDASWCDGLRQCSEGDVFSLASEMAVVQDLDVEQCDPETAVLAVTGLLAGLDRCGSWVRISGRHRTAACAAYDYVQSATCSDSGRRVH